MLVVEVDGELVELQVRLERIERRAAQRVLRDGPAERLLLGVEGEDALGGGLELRVERLRLLQVLGHVVHVAHHRELLHLLRVRLELLDEPLAPHLVLGAPTLHRVEAKHESNTSNSLNLQFYSTRILYITCCIYRYVSNKTLSASS